MTRRGGTGGARRAVALCAVVLGVSMLVACDDTDKDPGPGAGEGSAPATGDHPGSARQGVLDAWQRVGTDAGEWDRAAGFWADATVLHTVAGQLPEALGSDDPLVQGRARGTTTLLDRVHPSLLRALDVPPEDEGWHTAATDTARLAETDWVLDLQLRGPSPMNYWHGTTSWEALEGEIEGSGTWEATDDGYRYTGASPFWARADLEVSRPSQDAVVWSAGGSDWREALGTEPTMADLPGMPGLGECLAGADAVHFVVAGPDQDLQQMSSGIGARVPGYALGASLEDATQLEVWWCLSVPGQAGTVAGRAAPPSSWEAGSVVPGPPEALDADTVRVDLDVAEDEVGPVRILLNAPESSYPGY